MIGIIAEDSAPAATSWKIGSGSRKAARNVSTSVSGSVLTISRKRIQPRTRETRKAPETMRPARASARVVVTWRDRRSDGPRPRGPRMGVAVGRAEPGRRDVRVDLRRREALVAEQLLDDAQVGAAVEQVGRERVAERVRRDAVRQPGPATEQVEAVAQPADAERAAAVVQEDLGRASPRRRRAAPGLDEDGPAVLEVRLERLARRPAEQPDPLLAALAEDADLAAPQLQRAEIRRRQLADPETGRVGRLDERPVAEREGGRQRRVAASPPAGRGELLVDDREEPLDLVDLEDARQPARQARRRDRAPRIAGSEAVARRVAMERPDRGEALGRRAAGAARAEVGEVRPEVGSGRAAASRRRAASSQSRYAPTAVSYDRRVFGEASRAARPRRNRASAGWDAAAPLTRPERSRSVASAASPRVEPPRLPPRPPLRPPPRPAAAAPRAAAPRRPGERLRIRRPAREARPDEVLALGQRHVRAALQADPGLALPGDRPVVGVVERPDRLEVRRVVALGVVRAPPEDVAGPPRATGDEVAVVVLRAGDLERQRIGRRRTLLLDVVAVRVARAADERPEPAALADERPLAALRADLALAGLGRGPRRRAAAATPCARGTASRRGTGRSGRAGSPSGGPREQTSSVGSVVKSARRVARGASRRPGRGAGRRTRAAAAPTSRSPRAISSSSSSIRAVNARST